MKALEVEVREHKQANESLCKASAYFAPFGECSIRLPGRGTELDRRFKK